MKFCSNCGFEIENANQRFCSNCGTEIENGNMREAYSEKNNSAQGYQPFEQTPFQPQDFDAEFPTARPSMKWFKFLIYFSLFFGALINIIMGLNYITGEIYFSQSNGEITADMVYSVCGNELKVLDIIYGALQLAIAGYSIFTRFMLSKFKTNGPNYLYILYIVSAAVSLFYLIGVSFLASELEIKPEATLLTVFCSAIFVSINYRYFSKRKNMFVK